MRGGSAAVGQKATHPAGRASRAWAAAGSCWVPEVLGSSPSAGVAEAGRDTEVGFGVTLDTAAGDDVTPTTEGSSGSVAAVGSSFTENREIILERSTQTRVHNN